MPVRKAARIVEPPASTDPTDLADEGDLDSAEFVRAFARGLSVIEAMGRGTRHKTIAEVATLTGLPRSVAKRLLSTLCRQDYACTDGKFFELTPLAIGLGLSYLQSQPYWPYAQPALEDLRGQVEESCAMGVLHGSEIVYVLRIPSRRILAMNLNIGSRLPAHAVSIGRVLLAGLADTPLRALVRAAPKHKALLEAIETVRKQGYAWVDGALDPAISGLAVPVRDPAGRVIAAINVSVIAGSADEAQAVKRFLVPLRRAAEQIRAAMPREST